MAAPEVIAAAVADARAGMPMRAVAEKHGVPFGSIHRWVTRARIADGEVERKPETRKRRRAKNLEKPAKKADAPKAAKEEKEGKEERPAHHRSLRARDATAARIAVALGPELCADLREGVAGLVRFVATSGRKAADPLTAPDVSMKDVADAARALETLLTRTADVLAFDRLTNPEAATDGEAARLDRLASALGVKPGAPALTMLRGARAAEQS